MNVLFISNGSRGDINPFISLGMALKNRGHQVISLNCERYSKTIDFQQAEQDLCVSIEQVSASCHTK